MQYYLLLLVLSTVLQATVIPVGVYRSKYPTLNKPIFGHSQRTVMFTENDYEKDEEINLYYKSKNEFAKEFPKLAKKRSFSNNDNLVIHIKDTDTVITTLKDESLTSSVNNVTGASTFSANKLPLREFKYGSLMKNILSPPVPISNCLDSVDGDGGSITLVVTKTFKVSHSDSLKYGGGNILPLNTITFGFQVSASFAVAITDVLNVNANEVGQLLLSVFLVKVENNEYRDIDVYYSNGKTEFKSWEKLEDFYLYDKTHSYVVEGVTAPEKLMCGISPSSDVLLDSDGQFNF